MWTALDVNRPLLPMNLHVATTSSQMLALHVNQLLLLTNRLSIKTIILSRHHQILYRKASAVFLHIPISFVFFSFHKILIRGRFRFVFQLAY